MKIPKWLVTVWVVAIVIGSAAYSQFAPTLAQQVFDRDLNRIFGGYLRHGILGNGGTARLASLHNPVGSGFVCG